MMSNNTTGINSLDINSIVSTLVDAQKIPIDKLNNTKAVYGQQLSRYNELSSLMTKLNDSISNLKTIFNTNPVKINSSDETALNAVISGNGVAPGIYNLDVSQLASANQIASAAFSSKNTALGFNNSLSVTAGTNNFTLAINSTDTLDSIRNKINAAENTGVTASILATTASDGATAEYRLLLTSKETGTSQAMNLSGTAVDDFGLNNELSAAKDALFKFNGFDVVRSTNTISDLLDGTTMTLSKANSTSTLTISSDSSNQMANLKNGLTTFINAYNAIIDILDKNQASQSTRDRTYPLIKSQLQNTIQQSIGNGSIKRWVDMGVISMPSTKLVNENGVEFISSGKLSINDALLTTNISQNYEAIQDFFTLQNGFVTTFKTILTNITQDGGVMSNRENIIRKEEGKLEQKIERETARLDTIRDNLIRQYSALDNYIQRYNHIGSFIEQQLSAMDKSSK